MFSQVTPREQNHRAPGFYTNNHTTVIKSIKKIPNSKHRVGRKHRKANISFQRIGIKCKMITHR